MSRAPGLPEPWLSLAHAMGGVEALADKLQTTRWSVWAWANGHREPGPHVRDAVNDLARRLGVKEPFA